jgi:hypothetical protein
MNRKHNTDSNGLPWSEEIKLLVWSKATTIPNYSPDLWRRDHCSFAIMYADFGNRESMYGWEIDHIYPVALGGNDDLNNLQVLNCKNNEEKGDRLDWTCPR